MIRGLRLLALGWLAAPAGISAGAAEPLRPLPDPVSIPAGPALLGARDRVLFSLPGPAPRPVGAFSIDRTEVTNAAWATFVAATGRAPAAFAGDPELNAPDQPVTGVSWDDATAFCRWMGGRLPSEVEWEKAARGPAGQIYAWGARYDPGAAHLAGSAPVAVAAFPADRSPYGVRGMGGNVSEWVADTRLARGGVCGVSAMDAGAVSQSGVSLEEIAALFGEVRLCGVPATAPALSAPEPCAFIKGSSFAGRAHMTPAANRMWDYTAAYADFVGFRCAYDD